MTCAACKKRKEELRKYGGDALCQQCWPLAGRHWAESPSLTEPRKIRPIRMSDQEHARYLLRAKRAGFTSLSAWIRYRLDA